MLNRYGQPVDLELKRELFTVGKTVKDTVESKDNNPIFGGDGHESAE